MEEKEVVLILEIVSRERNRPGAEHVVCVQDLLTVLFTASGYVVHSITITGIMYGRYSRGKRRRACPAPRRPTPRSSSCPPTPTHRTWYGTTTRVRRSLQMSRRVMSATRGNDTRLTLYFVLVRALERIWDPTSLQQLDMDLRRESRRIRPRGVDLIQHGSDRPIALLPSPSLRDRRGHRRHSRNRSERCS